MKKIHKLTSINKIKKIKSMYWNYNYRTIVLVILFSINSANIISAQETSKEFWPEIDIWYKVTPAWRFSIYLPLSKNIETNYREGGFVMQTDYSWGKTNKILYMRMLDSERAEKIKSMMLRGGYLVGYSLEDNGQTYSENTAFTEFHLRIPLKGELLISHRLRADLRWLGQDNEFSQRFRYRLMIEKELHDNKVSYVPYFNVEPYYDSRYNTINRIRLIGGSSISWSSRYALEGNFTYQHDTRSSVTNLYAINLIAHFYFQTSTAAPK
jgi:hypothetical protein